MVIDATPAPDKVEGYNAFEKLRDPSHTRAMPLVELEAQLRASAPNPGDDDRLRQIAHDDIDRDQLGMNVHRRGGEVIIGYPTTIVVGKKT